MVEGMRIAEPFFAPLSPGLPLTGQGQFFPAHHSSKQLLSPALQTCHPQMAGYTAPRSNPIKEKIRLMKQRMVALLSPCNI